MPRRRRRLGHTEPEVTQQLLTELRSMARPLRSPADLDPLIELIGDSKYVLLGEASHGTHEYYTWRDALSRRLISEKGFSFVAVEGDWPDCYRVNQFVRGQDRSGASARAVLHNFERWPTWMWANHEVLAFIEWLHRRNQSLPEKQRAGFFGLDVYSLWDSLYEVLGYLAKHDSSAMPAARKAFQCFEPYGEDVQSYARATRWVNESCESEVVSLLSELRHLSRQPAPAGDGEARFNAEQNALVVQDAEHYYRTMVQGGPESWNIRDHHMVETLERLMKQHGRDAKAIVWEHNTHIGDARYTDMADDGLVNVGQLVRERHEKEGVCLVGFGCHRGHVIAGDEWDAPMKKMSVPPGRPGSWEDVLRLAGGGDRLLLLKEARENPEMMEERGHRAIGVVYHPGYEQHGNYVPTVLPMRYDAFLYLTETRTLRPLREVHARDEGEVPETYPTGV